MEILMPQHPSYSRRELRQRRKAWLRGNVSTVLVLTFGAIVSLVFITCLLLLTMPSDRFTWWFLGAIQMGVVAAYLSLLHSGFLLFNSDAMWHVRGATGEDNTRSELRRAKRKRHVWGWVDSVPLQFGDIDHLVVTRRGGLVAIDSKWRNSVHDKDEMARAAQKVRLRAEALTRDFLKADVRGRRRAKINPLRVTSIVVLWGAGQHEVPDGDEVDGIVFLPGRQLVPWLAQLGGESVDKAAAKDVVDNLERRRAQVEAAQAARASSGSC